MGGGHKYWLFLLGFPCTKSRNRPLLMPYTYVKHRPCTSIAHPSVPFSNVHGVYSSPWMVMVRDVFKSKFRVDLRLYGIKKSSLCYNGICFFYKKTSRKSIRVTINQVLYRKGHFTHEPRAMTMKLWEPERKCPKAIPRHLQNHVVWSRILKCSVKSYVTGPSTKCYFNAGPRAW